ncbi:MAG: protein translocase subunit SecF [Candidatus Aenigmarchaeota archaeon]|nr:protein translocase subunit SecF [Candidatus Aenigmarchaeota archaeon]
MIFEKFDRHWKVWILIPSAILVFSLVVIASNILATGFFMARDVELQGGKVITAEVSSVDIAELNQKFPQYTVHVTTGATTNVLLQMPFEADENAVISRLKEVVPVIGEPGVKSVGPALGDIFWRQTYTALITAFVFMSLFVFILFRTPVPSSIVILAAATDIMATIAILSLIGMKLSLPVLAALLMIIGYSVDTDILLTSSLLKKRREEIAESLKSAMKTGLLMSLTTLVALAALFLISGSFVLNQIAIVLIIGILIDMPATWMGNAGWLRLWLEKHSGGS